MAKKKDEQQNRKISYANFDLTSFKLTAEGALVEHHVSGVDAGIVSKKCEGAPHPELLEALESLKRPMADRLGLLEFTDYIIRNAGTGALELIEAAKEQELVVVERMNPNGAKWQGSGEGKGLQITGSFKVPKLGSTPGLAVPKITFKGEDLGYEADVEALAEVLKQEVYQYRFNGKRKQQTLPLPEADDDN